jgi:quercetin dioxygenase-like cupin family protein
MSTTSSNPNVSHVDFAVFEALAADQRHSQKLLDRASGGDRVGVTLIRTPAGQGSPEGLHTHEFEQVFYVLSGEMNVEIDGEVFRAGPGSLVRFAEGVPHRNWNDKGSEATLHLAINAPAPQPGKKLANPVA